MQSIAVCEVELFVFNILKMQFLFSNEEFADWHFMYGYSNGNLLAGNTEYQERFPNRIPNHKTVASVSHLLRKTGTIPKCSWSAGRQDHVVTHENILQQVQCSLGLVQDEFQIVLDCHTVQYGKYVKKSLPVLLSTLF